MRIIIPAIAILFLLGCSTPPTVKVESQPSARTITSLDDATVAYDRSAVAEVELDASSNNLPKLVSKVEPYYPEIALRAGLEGNVQVHTLIAPSGQVRSARVLDTTAEIFNQSALEAAIKWKFEPPIVDGKPAAVWVKIPFRFAISK